MEQRFIAAWRNHFRFFFLLLAIIGLINSPTLSKAQEFSAATTANYGDIIVMEVAGNYDAETVSGSPNYLPRQVITRELYKTHLDNYDFLLIFSTFEYQMPADEVAAFYLAVRNDIQGIGLEVFDNSTGFGSNGKLQGTIDMGNVNSLESDPLAPAFSSTMGLISHELMHRWGSYVKFIDNSGSLSAALLGKDNDHWSFLLDTDGSVAYGNRWQDNGDSSFTSLPGRKYFSQLDLYLMGLADPSEVPPMLLIENTEIDHTRVTEQGVTIDGTPTYVSIEDIISAEGVRVPDTTGSQKSFRIGTILLTRPNTVLTHEITAIRNITSYWTMWFSSLTDGKALAVFDDAPLAHLPTNPGVTPQPHEPRQVPADIADGVAWLVNNQEPDGRWQDSSHTSERDTTEAIIALQGFTEAEQNYLDGLGWLNGIPFNNIDYLAREIEAKSIADEDVTSSLDLLTSWQNPDGGWGSSSHYMSSPTDTSFALRALAVAGFQDAAVLAPAMKYVNSQQNPDGGWGGSLQDSTIQTTTNMLVAINQYRQSYELDSAIQAGIQWLYGKQNPDGGFGNSPSTVYDTSLALSTLNQFNGSQEAISNSLGYLRSLQSVDGSWHASAHQTALAVNAIWQSTIEPDLSVSTADITVTPEMISALPADVEISATIHNSGQTDVSDVTVALYLGAIAENNKIGEQSVSVARNSSAGITFTATLTEGDTQRLYIVVDPEGLVQESSTSNNSALKTIYSETTYDFSIAQDQLVALPAAAEILQPIAITAQISNTGTRDGYNVPVVFSIEKDGQASVIAQANLDLPAGQTTTHQFTWTADISGASLMLTAAIDPDNILTETSEANNSAAIPLAITPSTKANLAIRYQDITITPSPAPEKGTATIAVPVNNSGSVSAENFDVLFYKGIPETGGILIGTTTIASIPAEESLTASINWANIPEPGDFQIYIQVDPDDRVLEIREDDNTAFTYLTIITLPDFLLSATAISFAPRFPTIGQTVTIEAVVHNLGEQAVENVPVSFYEDGALIETVSVPLVPGGSNAVATIQYYNTGTSGVHNITISVDQDNSILEQDEANNSASSSFIVQDADQWVSERFISPNGDSSQDDTVLFFQLAAPETVTITIVDEEGKVVRTFSGPDYENITAGTVTWDGLDDIGRVVPDGVYTIEILNELGTVLGLEQISIDNNRSSLLEAIRSDNILQLELGNLFLRDRNWQWLPDDSGILFHLASIKWGHTPGLYLMSPDREAITRIVPWEWSLSIDPVYDYRYKDKSSTCDSVHAFSMSPDGQHIAFILEKEHRINNTVESNELWRVDRFGNNLTLLASFDWLAGEQIEINDVIWAPDSSKLLYKTHHLDTDTFSLSLVQTDGTLSATFPTNWDAAFSPFAQTHWAPDSSSFIFADNLQLILADTSGNTEEIFAIKSPRVYIDWFSSQKILLRDSLPDPTWEDDTWIIDLSGQNSPILVGENLYTEPTLYDDNECMETYTGTGNAHALHPAGDKFLITKWNYVDYTDWGSRGDYYVCDSDGSCQWVPYLINVDTHDWSPDGRKLLMNDWRSGYLNVVDLEIMETDMLPVGPDFICRGTYDWRNEYLLSHITPQLHIQPAPEGFCSGEYIDLVDTFDPSPPWQWLSDTTFISWDWKGNHIFDYTDMSRTYIPPVSHDSRYFRLSSTGRYLTYDDHWWTSRYNPQKWLLGSLLNLTADLKISQNEDNIILKGVAVDLNFSHYVLEYAELDNPDDWSLIVPPSDRPVKDEVFTTWVPPHDGYYLVRLTAFDQAGNQAHDMKRIAWGLTPTVSELYLTKDIFSPNSDGSQDVMALHYSVTQPVHLEFFVYDEYGLLVKRLTSDPTIPGEHFVSWDGRDEEGNFVDDGVYSIRIFEHEFWFEVDVTPPTAILDLSEVDAHPSSGKLHSILTGFADDTNLKSWVIEYGDGPNPEEWVEYKSGVYPLYDTDDDNYQIDKIIDEFRHGELEFLVNKKFRITVEDFAGNRSVEDTELIQEFLLFTAWKIEPTSPYYNEWHSFDLTKDQDGSFNSGKNYIPAGYINSDLNTFESLETIIAPLERIYVQYRYNMAWLEGPEIKNLPSGTMLLDWDNSDLEIVNLVAVRLKGIDVHGAEYLSNTIIIDTTEIFRISGCQSISIAQMINVELSLLEDIVSQKLQVKSSGTGVQYPQWTDYWEETSPSLIPLWLFAAPTLAELGGEASYYIRSAAIGASGNEYFSNLLPYPLPECASGSNDDDEDPPPTDPGTSGGSGTAETCNTLASETVQFTSYLNVSPPAIKKSLDVYLLKTEGDVLLQSIDLTTQNSQVITIDTAEIEEGAYQVKSVLTYLLDGAEQTKSTLEDLIVDRQLPQAEITAPVEGVKVCSARYGQEGMPPWLGANIEGLVADTGRVGRYGLFYQAILGNWSPAMTRLGCPADQSSCSISQTAGPDEDISIDGSLGTWDVTDLTGLPRHLKLEVEDQVGNLSCETILVDFDRDILLDASYDRLAISPNDDGAHDTLALTFTVAGETAYGYMRVLQDDYHKRYLPTISFSPDTPNTVTWDGRADSRYPDPVGPIVPDGTYTVVATIYDYCGNSTEHTTAVEVDNTPPVVQISYPQPADPLGIVVEIQGTAYDKNFTGYTLGAVNAIDPTQTLLLAQESLPVEQGVLGTWNTLGLTGQWILKLSAEDSLGNSLETSVVVNLGDRATLIQGLTAIPVLFSPNNDGNHDISVIDFEIGDTSNITLEILSSNLEVIHSYEATGLAPGSYQQYWDGLDSIGAVAADGAYTVKLSAVLAANAGVFQEETISIEVDNTSPIVGLSQPVPDSYLMEIGDISGSITDQHLAGYTITYTGPDSIPVTIATGSQNREAYTFAALNSLAEGAYTLTVEALDQVDNSTSNVYPFTIDTTKPEAVLLEPEDGTLYGGASTSILIKGQIVEENFEYFSLRYRENPANQWSVLATETAMPATEELFTWEAGSDSTLADGDYVLSLYVVDKAGWTAEAQATITIDNTPPEVTFVSPDDNAFVKQASDIQYLVMEKHLAEHIVEISEGNCATAATWSPAQVTTNPMADGISATVSALPPEGNYCIRVTAIDELGSQATATRNFTIDTTPPAPPVLSGVVENNVDAVLSWQPNSEPDLAGYVLYKVNQPVSTELFTTTEYRDENLDEAYYTYILTAVDLAGLESAPSAPVGLWIDKSGPTATIISPLVGGTVSGLVNIKGTAFSADDFKQYRVYIKEQAAPSWSLIRTSPLATTYDVLAQWETFGLDDGSFSIKLEAEDLAGNIDLHEISVSVDNTPPSAPVLLSATGSGEDVAIEWQPNAEEDLAGYLLYRNHQLVNVDGTVIGSLAPYIIQGTTYTDIGAPDGTHTYYLEAMDQAGNISVLSNSLDVTLENHPPHAWISSPADGYEFDTPMTVKAKSEDLDIAEVLFQYKSVSSTTWVDLGTSTSTPFYMVLDPEQLSLAYGDYELRAVATGLNGQTDPAPEAITVSYANVSPPSPPEGLAVLVDGDTANLTWSPNSEADLAGYTIYHYYLNSSGTESKAKLNNVLEGNTFFAKQYSYADGRQYSYTVTATDSDGNESAHSDRVTADFYKPDINQPLSPVSLAEVEVFGTAAGSSTVDLMAEDEAGQILQQTVSADAEGNFVATLTLSPGNNSITAKATDSLGNISMLSDPVTVFYNLPPTAPTGLTAIGSEVSLDVSLSWNANLESDILGYYAYRDGVKLQQPSLVDFGTASSTWSSQGRDYYVIDNNLNTYWEDYISWNCSYDCTGYETWWYLNMGSWQLISRIEIIWRGGNGEPLYGASDFSIEAWDGSGWIPLATVTGNEGKSNVFDFPVPFGTDQIQIFMSDAMNPDDFDKYVAISEVRIFRENFIPAAAYMDQIDDAGEYSYQVTAVDIFGLESELSEPVTAIAGDINPPSVPLNLTAAPSGTDISLSWSAVADADVAGYNLYRSEGHGWFKLNTSSLILSTYLDSSLPNNTYTYRVTAVDLSQNESDPSSEASATITAGAETPPSPAVVTVTPNPEGSQLTICWETVTGALGYRIYRRLSSTDALERIYSTESTTGGCFVDQELDDGISYTYFVITLGSGGTESPMPAGVEGVPENNMPLAQPMLTSPTTAESPLTVFAPDLDISGQAGPGSENVYLFQNGRFVNQAAPTQQDILLSHVIPSPMYAIKISPDGEMLAYRDSGGLFIRVLATDETRQVYPGSVQNFSWSFDSRRLAFTYVNDSGYYTSIAIYELLEATTTELPYETGQNFRNPSWSKDGSRITYEKNMGGMYYSICQFDLSLQHETVLQSNLNTLISSSSPDGTMVAYVLNYRNNPSLYVYDSNSYTRNVDSYIYSHKNIPLAAWSPDGTKLAYISWKYGQPDLIVWTVGTYEYLRLTDSAYYEYQLAWSPDSQSLVYASDYYGNKQVWLTSADGSSEPLLLADTPWSNYPDFVEWTLSGSIFLHYDKELRERIPAGSFSFSGIELDRGENRFIAIAEGADGDISPPSETVSITFSKDLLPDLKIFPEDIYVYPSAPLAGQTVEIFASVQNYHSSSLENITIDLYILDSNDTMELVKSETIPSLAAGDWQVVSFTWNTTGREGINTIYAVLDPDDLILEKYESNNLAENQFFVAADEGVDMTAWLDQTTYKTEKDVMLSARLFNSGLQAAVRVEAAIYDAYGYLVDNFGSMNVTLPYSADQVHKLTWNTGALYAGEYQVQVTLEQNGEILEEIPLGFTILPDLDIQADLTLDQAAYQAAEDVHLSLSVTNNGRNFIVPAQDVVFRVRSSTLDQIVDENSIYNLWPADQVGLTASWSSADMEPGVYDAVAEIYYDGQLVTTAGQSFILDSVANLVADSACDAGSAPLNLRQDHTLSLQYVITNNGNMAAVDAGLTALLIDPASLAEVDSLNDTVTLGVNESQTVEFAFSAGGLGVQAYKVLLQTDNGNGTVTLSECPVQVISVTPPLLEIVAPGAGSSQNRDVSLAVKARATNADIEILEFAIDDNENWTPMAHIKAATGQYGFSTWDSTTTADGQHTIHFRALDSLGNSSTQDVVASIDNTPPAAPLLLTAFAAGNDVNLAWQANTETDLDIYQLYRNHILVNNDIPGTAYIDLENVDGSHTYHLTASDMLGNVSDNSNTLSVTVETGPPAAMITDPEDGKQFNDVLTIIAETADRDIAGVQLQYKADGSAAWTDLGSPLAEEPYVVQLDGAVLGLSYGHIQLRAVATDTSGNTDPNPQTITVVYADNVPPAAPSGLAGEPIGSTIALTWSANTESDLAGYNVYQVQNNHSIKLNSDVVLEPLFNFQADADGIYTFAVTAVDIFSNESLPTEVSVETLAPLSRLTGTLTVAPVPVYFGRDADLLYSLNNVSVQAIEDLTVMVDIVDPADNTIVVTLSAITSIAGETVLDGNFNLSTAGLAVQDYMASLVVAEPSAAESRTLAEAYFTVEPSLEVSFGFSDQANLLVWINYGCTDAADCLNDYRIELLQQMLDEAQIPYEMVYEPKTFEWKMRSPFITDILILGDQHPLTDHSDAELRELVYSGTGYISSLWHMNSNLDPVFDIKVLGVIPGESMIQTVESPITADGAIMASGKVVEIVESDQVIGGWLLDSGQNPICPAIILNEFGNGRTIFFSFDLLKTLDDANYVQITDIILNSLAEVHSPLATESFTPYQVVPIALRTQSLGGGFNVENSIAYSDLLRLYDPATGLWIEDNPWTTAMQLGPDEQFEQLFYVLTPDAVGTYFLTAETGFEANGVYNLFETFDLEITVDMPKETLITEIISELNSFSLKGQEQAKINNAIKLLEKIQKQETTDPATIESNIQDIIKDIDSLMFIESIDIHAVRLMLSTLLSIEYGMNNFTSDDGGNN